MSDVVLPDGFEACATGGYRRGDGASRKDALRLFVGAEQLPDEDGLARLLEIAGVPGVVPPVVVLPDFHLKVKNYVPSGVAVALREAVSPRLLGPPNDAMLLAHTGLGEAELTPARLDAVFGALLESIAMFRRRDPVVAPDAVDAILRFGARAVAGDFGFDARDLLRMECGGNAFDGAAPPDASRVRAAFPGAGQRPAALPDFVPSHHLDEAAVRSLGVLDGGSHFLELDVVEELLDAERAAALGLRVGQVLAALHAGSGDVGLIAHKHHLTGGEPRLESFAPGEPEGSDFLLAYRGAANFGFANRLALLARLREALQRSVGRTARVAVLSDVPHDMLDVLPDPRGRIFLHRKGAVRTLPPRPAPHDAAAGRPFYFPSAPGGPAFVLASRHGNAESQHTCSHGAGRRWNRDEAVARFDAEAVARDVAACGVRLYRYGQTDFASQAPASYKALAPVLEALRAGHLAEPVARLRPLAVLKG